ncbi:MAG: bifunctional oligoribonuclease/PAP phosphatase NrnA [Oscillospiraceae bacterium]|nr:bifunctional oligoribonuclease/PAP phosphatase NrnA [Oscillospiraceae bacterium]
MNKSINLQELKEKILSADFNNILIICHIDPDPDTLGSSLGLKQIFEKLNKTACIVSDTKVNDRVCGYFGVAPELDLSYIKSSGFRPDYIICVDAGDISQIGKYGEYYSEDISQNKIDIVIDHHYTNSFYGKATYLDEKAAATGEIIFDLAKELNLEIDKTFANNIYCAIICDSGSFRYSSTTAKTMSIASELISTGFDFAKLNRLIFQSKTMIQIATERLAYNSLKLFVDGKIAFITITKEMKKAAGLEGVELDGINEIPKIIEGVEVGITIKEEETGNLNANTKVFKISLRSNEYVNVAEIAMSYNGGGHPRAAGCKCEFNIDFDVDLLEKELVEKIKKVL